jgi:hypothetical protein
MAKPFLCDIRIIEGSGFLPAGQGFVNETGFANKMGQSIVWSQINNLRRIEARSGSAASGALAAGTVGLLAGPPVAMMAALGGATLSVIGGARALYALQLDSGADMLFDIGLWQCSALEKRFRAAQNARAKRPIVFQGQKNRAIEAPVLLDMKESQMLVSKVDQTKKLINQGLRRLIPGAKDRGA